MSTQATQSTQQSQLRVVAEPDEEVFDVLNDQGEHIGTAPRAHVHKEGLYHGAVYVLVFNKLGQLLIQKRSQAKKVMPGRWDLSVAEHLSAGESYQQGAVRGLDEELGLQLDLNQCQVHVINHPRTSTQDASPLTTTQPTSDTSGLTLTGPLTARHERRLDLPEISIKDYEFVETWRLDGWRGGPAESDEGGALGVVFNAHEVEQIKWVGLQELGGNMRDYPELYTPWFLDEANLLGLVPL